MPVTIRLMQANVDKNTGKDNEVLQETSDISTCEEQVCDGYYFLKLPKHIWVVKFYYRHYMIDYKVCIIVLLQKYYVKFRAFSLHFTEERLTQWKHE